MPTSVQNVFLIMFICIILLPFVCAFVFGPPSGTSIDDSYYAKSACVVEIDRDADVVTFEDCMGNLWDWEGVEDWAIDDDAALLMDSKDTETIYDDEIISVKFENWG